MVQVTQLLLFGPYNLAFDYSQHYHYHNKLLRSLPTNIEFFNYLLACLMLHFFLFSVFDFLWSCVLRFGGFTSFCFRVCLYFLLFLLLFVRLCLSVSGSLSVYPVPLLNFVVCIFPNLFSCPFYFRGYISEELCFCMHMCMSVRM